MTRALVITLGLVSFLLAGGEVPPQLDPYNPQYEPGVVLVKFKDTVQLDHNALARTTNPVFGVSSVDLLNLEFEIQEVHKVFSQPAKRSVAKMVQMPDGYIEAPNLHNIYKLSFSGNASVELMIQAFEEDPNVEYAEPDYLFRAMETIPDDPMYSQQWHHAAVNAPALWDSTTGDTSQIIGIIDTGVDWDHPDLAENIWINWAEYHGADGVDDDGNGYVDDIRGWDWISDDNDPNDDNSHGTHVAGIAAGVGNNGIGITGVSWSSKIMSLKVLQSTGFGNSSDIASAVEYAGSNGATVMNLSLGSYGHSQVMENALAVAYNTTIEVAAAGNSGLCIGPGPCPDMRFGSPMYPGAFSWVLGVQAGDAMGPMGFSNYDQDGPQESGYIEGYNYEIKAPGAGINSTFPNGGYHSLNGTSMASPIVAGGIANILVYEEPISTELFRAKLINNTGTHVDLYETLIASEPDPILSYVSHTIVDTCETCDNDGRADAGETIELWFTVKNYGGYADSVTVSTYFADFEDTTSAQIQTGQAYIGDVSSYSQLSNELDPIVLFISDNIANNRQIGFDVFMSDRGNESFSTGIVLNIQNGFEVGGVLIEDAVWTSEREYLVTENLRVSENVRLTVMPGTRILISPGKQISIRGSLLMEGTKDSLIYVTSASGMPDGKGLVYGSGTSQADTISIEYVNFSNLGAVFEGVYGWKHGLLQINNCIIKQNGAGNGATIIYNVGPRWGSSSSNFQFIGNLYTGNSGKFVLNTYFGGQAGNVAYMQNNLYMGNLGAPYGGSYHYAPINGVVNSYQLPDTLAHYYGNSYVNNKGAGGNHISIGVGGNSSIMPFEDNYYGIENLSIIEQELFYDFYDDASLPMIQFTPILTEPTSATPGFSWKVEIDAININRYDNPYNSVAGLGIIGPETHKFDVYFNRAMDTTFTPFLTFGVDQPYTQHVVNDSASWSTDASIWTAYKTMGIETGDGINRIRVSGARDDENFEIPIEDQRFEFALQAAGAASVQFIATPGIGKVDLEWPPASTDDALGYNMYRSLRLNDSTWASYEMTNDILITDSTYTDFEVIPDSTYKYQYTVLGTDFAESDPSKTVPATPFSAANGDANGDLAVNVLDIISMVSYVLEGSPTPFLFDAADLNGDDQVNVLDIISVINIILGNTAKIATQPGEAIAALEDNEFWISSQNPIGGLQLKLSGDLENARVTSQYAMELTSSINADGDMIVLLYSMSGEVLPIGNHAIVRIEGTGSISINEMIVSDPRGQVMLSRIGDPNEVKLPNTYILKQNYPNPFNASTTIEYAIPEVSDITMTIYNLRGQKVFSRTQSSVAPGWYAFTWNGNDLRGKTMASGLYLYRFEAKGYSNVRKMLLLK
ncbi:MAG: S8 family serine peptidase [Candidatus Marinimicrobia bacterium]|jgi:subtilisin family serine protease|nr:S8 family serine peptidase [Candidatus Neomarinimicrobiota bacterium]